MRTAKIWNGSFKDWITVPLVGSLILVSTFQWTFLRDENIEEFFRSVAFSFAFWSSLANGNGWIIRKLDDRYTWLEAPIKRTVVGIIVMLTYSVIVSLLINYIGLEFLIGVDFFLVLREQGLFSMLAIPLAITVVSSLWGHGRAFLLEWREAAIKIEKLKNENLKTHFESLKSQVNPHFLFNSLNALSSLVYDNQERAVEFIHKLSGVYRYVLDQQNEEVVELSEEMNFLKSYVYLNKIRFGDNFNVDFKATDQSTDQLMIPPVALQMLVENAIKHNEISQEHPLKIDVKTSKDSVTVSNNINPLKAEKPDSSGLGLTNIRERYGLLTDREIVIIDQPAFSVTLPLLTIS